MFKRNSISVAFSATVFTMACLFSLPVTAQAQQPQHSTSSANIESKPRRDEHKVYVGSLKSAQVGSAIQWKAYRVSDTGNFNLEILPVGQYELIVTPVETRVGGAEGRINPSRGKSNGNDTRIADADKAAPPDTSSKAAPANPRTESNVLITLYGVKGGSMKRGLAVTSKRVSETTRTTFVSPKTEHMTFEADGKSAVSGTLLLVDRENGLILERQ